MQSLSDYKAVPILLMVLKAILWSYIVFLLYFVVQLRVDL
jgi:hypothetical protein